MKILVFLLIILTTISTSAQVGINNTDPKAILDITATNVNSPQNTDGILIPRITTFSATNPTADQNGMLVFLTTTVGANTPGFYFWDEANTQWASLGANTPDVDFDWYEVGTNTEADDITDKIYTYGNVVVGHNEADGGRMLISSDVGDTRFTIESDRSGAFPTANPTLRLRRAVDNLTDFREARIDLEGKNSGDVVLGSNPNDMLFLSEFGDVGFQFIPNSTPTLTINPSGQLTLDSYNTATSYTGTATSILGLDANGNLIQEALPSGGATNAWTLTGNAGTDEAINFLGTTDAKDVLFRRNNIDKIRIDLSWTAFTDEIKIKKSGTAGSADDLVRLDDSGGSNSGRVTVFNDDDVQHYIDGEAVTEFNRLGLDTDFRIESTTDADAFLLDATNGQIKFGNYGGGTITGTATRSLAVDANGLIIEQPLATAVNAWNLAGNAGTTNGTDFIGTTDAQDLDIRTNNIIHQRFTTTGQLEFLNTGGSINIGENTGTNDDLANRRNVLIGEGMAPNISTGSSSTFDSAYNVGVGYQSLISLTSGASNIALGRQTLNSITTQNENIAIGRQALEDNTGGQNIAIGAYSGLQRASGNQNTFIGYNSNGFGVSTGNNNSGLGAQTLSRLTTGTSNTAIGNGTGSRLTTGSYNTIIGVNAGMSESGGGASVEGSVIIGNAAGATNAINNAFILHNVKTFGATSAPLLSGIFRNSTYNSLNNGPLNENRLGVNVDLGTNAANLTHTLTVNGNAFASGGFMTTANNYPDYVFEDYFTGSSQLNQDYKFMGLKKAIEFVKINGHLPNVVSYKEIKANDMKIDLGKTSIKNLEKIEENFIYIKELSEKNEILEKENEALKIKLDLILVRLNKLEKKQG